MTKSVMNRRIVQLSASVGCCVSCFYGFSLVRHDFVVNLWPYSTVFLYCVQEFMLCTWVCPCI